jgi:translocation and assembly module TamA
MVEIIVTEKPRWLAEVGVGWNSDTGVEGRIGLGDENLFGRGVGLNLRARWNQVEKVTLLYGSFPARPGSRLSFLATAGYMEGESPTAPDIFDQYETTGSIEGTYQIRPGTWARAYYRHTRTRVFEREEPIFGDPIDITTTVGTVGLQYILDRFDNPFDPRRGWGFTGDVGWSSSYFGSDLQTLRTVVTASGAIAPPVRGSTWVQSMRLGDARGIEGTNLDPQLRFLAGGQGSIRGFDRNSVGPSLTGAGGNPVPLGGGALFILNEELRFALWKSLRAAVFADIGQVWESWSDAEGHLSVGAGVGVRWSTPIGLVWGDVAWPVANQGISSDGPKFYFGIGRPF